MDESIRRLSLDKAIELAREHFSDSQAWWGKLEEAIRLLYSGGIALGPTLEGKTWAGWVYDTPVMVSCMASLHKPGALHLFIEKRTEDWAGAYGPIDVFIWPDRLEVVEWDVLGAVLEGRHVY